MLGWEFPPHISGGLGTACFGLTQGLYDCGVEVLFVVPRSHGDEDQRFVRVLGANQIELAPRDAGIRARSRVEREERPGAERSWIEMRRRAGGATEPQTDAGGGEAFDTEDPRSLDDLGGHDSIDDAIEGTLRVLAIPSALRAYEGEQAYAARVRGAAASAMPSQPESESEREAREAVEALARTLREAPGLIEVERTVAELGGALHGARRLSFSGSYGPDLMGEVARFALAVGEASRRETFDVIHAHDWMTYPAGLVASRLSGKPLVVHMHACEYDRSGEHVNARIRELEQLGLDGADRIICVSHYTSRMLRTHYRVDRSRLRVVHNAVTHKEQVAALHAEKTLPEPIVLFLGRVTFQKGPDYFLEAAARVVRVEPFVKFVISGSGDMLPRMIERAARLGLARHVHFTGFLRGAEVERMYAMADIYVMPSVSEPFGISPLEAMALDVPVIVSRQSGVSEVLVNALKVDFWDVQEMANKILALLRYPALREQLSTEGREEVRRLRWDQRARAVVDVYKEVLR